MIIWDSANNIGQAVSISYKWPSPDLSAYATSESKRAAQIQAFIDLYNGNENPILTENYHTVAHGDSRWITQEQYQTIISGGEGSSLKYLRSLDDVSKEDLLKAIEESKANAESNNTNTNTNSNTNTNTNSNSNSNVPSSSSNIGSNTAQRSYSSVGTSSNNRVNDVSDASDESDNSDGSPSDSGKSYEVTKQPVTKSASNNNLIYAVVGVLIIGVLFGVGYMRRKN